MAGLSCSICLEDMKVPVCPPCGHLHCEVCLHDHIEAGTDPISSNCPTCRASFPIVSPNLETVPRKYHMFIIPPLRRVFVDISRESTELLKADITALELRIASLERDKALLMAKCESNSARANAHAEGETKARKEADKYKKGYDKYKKETKKERERREMWETKFKELVDKVNAIQASTSSDAGDDVQPSANSSPGSSHGTKRKSSQVFGGAYPRPRHEQCHHSIQEVSHQEEADEASRPILSLPLRLKSRLTSPSHEMAAPPLAATAATAFQKRPRLAEAEHMPTAAPQSGDDELAFGRVPPFVRVTRTPISSASPSPVTPRLRPAIPAVQESREHERDLWMSMTMADHDDDVDYGDDDDDSLEEAESIFSLSKSFSRFSPRPRASYPSWDSSDASAHRARHPSTSASNYNETPAQRLRNMVRGTA